VRRGRKEEAAQRGIQGASGDGIAFGEKTLAELSAEFGVHPTMISNWKQELVKRAGELFARGSKAAAVEDAQKVIDDLHRKIGQLQVECDFLAGQPAISRVLRGGR
jgi:transposase-like protein